MKVLSLQARGTSSYLHFVVSHLFYGTPFRLKYCSVVYNVCLIKRMFIFPPVSDKSKQSSVRRSYLWGNPVKYVICKTINKYLSSNLTSLKSFIEMEEVKKKKKLCFTPLVLVLQHTGGVTGRELRDSLTQSGKQEVLFVFVENFFVMWILYNKCIVFQRYHTWFFFFFCQNADVTKTKLSRERVPSWSQFFHGICTAARVLLLVFCRLALVLQSS